MGSSFPLSEKRSYLCGAVEKCPLSRCPPGCSLRGIRKLNAIGRRNAIDGLSETEINRMLESHIQQVSQRIHRNVHRTTPPIFGDDVPGESTCQTNALSGYQSADRLVGLDGIRTQGSSKYSHSRT